MAPRLLAPPATFAKQPLPTAEIKSSRFVRVSRFGSGEPFFARSGGSRFDDPRRRFGTCYFGFDLVTAVAETVLHDEMPIGGRFLVAKTELESRHIVRLRDGETLTVADFTDAALKTTVGDGSISTVFPYDLPQQWAAAVHAHPAKVDGIRYVSRQLNGRKAVVVFERAAPRLHTATYEPLGKSRSLANVRKVLCIDYTMP